MAKVGILMHSRHLETVGWKNLVWGVPAEDSVGSLPKVVELLLHEAPTEPIMAIVLGCGPSQKDGMNEGEYTKHYLLSHLNQLREFPRFAHLSEKKLAEIRARLEKVIIMQPPMRTIDEIIGGTKIFAELGITKALQVTAASHAPRCIQVQAAARAKGLIPSDQLWALVVDDRSYRGATPFSTLIMEPPHHGDDPMFDALPSLPELLRDYQYGLSPANKKRLAEQVAVFMKEHANESDIRDFKS